MGRIQGLTDTVALTEDQLLKTGRGFVFSMTVAWTGATAGDIIQVRDGTDGTGTPKIVIICDSANNTKQFSWANGKEFTTGIFYDEGPATTLTEITYK